MSVLDQDTGIDYAALSAETLSAVQAGGPDAERVSAVTLYPAHGQVTFATAFIWGTVAADLTFDTGEKMHFDGKHWGIGLGGGTSYGAAVFSIPPRELVGGGTYEVHSQATVGGYVQVNFFKNNTPVGTFTGAALAVNLSIGGGSGTWTMS